MRGVPRPRPANLVAPSTRQRSKPYAKPSGEQGAEADSGSAPDEGKKPSRKRVRRRSPGWNARRPGLALTVAFYRSRPRQSSSSASTAAPSSGAASKSSTPTTSRPTSGRGRRPSIAAAPELPSLFELEGLRLTSPAHLSSSIGASQPQDIRHPPSSNDVGHSFSLPSFGPAPISIPRAGDPSSYGGPSAYHLSPRSLFDLPPISASLNATTASPSPFAFNSFFPPPTADGLQGGHSFDFSPPSTAGTHFQQHFGEDPRIAALTKRVAELERYVSPVAAATLEMRSLKTSLYPLLLARCSVNRFAFTINEMAQARITQMEQERALANQAHGQWTAPGSTTSASPSIPSASASQSSMDGERDPETFAGHLAAAAEDQTVRPLAHAAPRGPQDLDTDATSPSRRVCSRRPTTRPSLRKSWRRKGSRPPAACRFPCVDGPS